MMSLDSQINHQCSNTLVRWFYHQPPSIAAIDLSIELHQSVSELMGLFWPLELATSSRNTKWEKILYTIITYQYWWQTDQSLKHCLCQQPWRHVLLLAWWPLSPLQCPDSTHLMWCRSPGDLHQPSLHHQPPASVPSMVLHATLCYQLQICLLVHTIIMQILHK